MSDYNHVQPGTTVRWILLGMLLFFALFATTLWATGVEDAAGMLLPCVPLLLLFPLFHSLGVHVTRDEIRLRFGIGLIRKRIPLEDVRETALVENHWWNGWGIKKIRHGWLYNVSGFQAVELRTMRGRVYRIGSDEPRALKAAVDARLEAKPGERA